MRLHRQCFEARAVFRQDLLEGRARVGGLDPIEGGQRVDFQERVVHPAQYIIGLSATTEPAVSTEAFDLISIGGGSGGLACAQRG